MTSTVDTTANTIFNQSTTSKLSECSDHLPSSEYMLEHMSDSDHRLGVTCLVMTILVVLLYAEEMIILRMTYRDKLERYKVMGLLGIYPIFCVCSMVGLVVPRSLPMTEFITTFYVSMAMFILQRMIVLLMAGENNLVQVFKESNLPLAVPPVCCICPCILKFIRINVSTKSVTTARLFVLQGAIIRPALSFSFGVYSLNTVYEDSDKTLVTTIHVLNGVSMALAMFGLQIIYRLTREYLQTELGQTRIRRKFACFQLVVLFGIAQPNIFNILLHHNIPGCSPPYGTRVRSLRYINMFTVFEMFFIAIMARLVYHPRKPDQPWPEQGDGRGQASENPALAISSNSLPVENRSVQNREDRI